MHQISEKDYFWKNMVLLKNFSPVHSMELIFLSQVYQVVIHLRWKFYDEITFLSCDINVFLIYCQSVVPLEKCQYLDEERLMPRQFLDNIPIYIYSARFFRSNSLHQPISCNYGGSSMNFLIDKTCKKQYFVIFIKYFACFWNAGYSVLSGL